MTLNRLCDIVSTREDSLPAVKPARPLGITQHLIMAKTEMEKPH